ncbi:NAD-dependent deacylase [Mesorhizobium xinjiangense]|uniref:NAD-dependent deacylase n=1 Tax=Mesorhizobium xinjiangense TaxID=2678685 RepID=UPI0012EE8F81|nr:NAD-dependent deacylase [Mesorhizobium xinjiangense]
MIPSSIVILTGAGISAESGLSTFRDIGGIWSKIDYRDVATPEGYARNPGLVHDFYNRRRRKMKSVQPNAAHHALARLDGAFDGDFLLVTQNIDDLHESAGARRLVHMHGELASALCEACGQRSRWPGDMSVNSQCPHCATVGRLRPDVVWFGEMPYHMDRIYAALGGCDLFVAIGTSGSVYPAAQFVEEAALAGARTVELNLEPSENHALFDDSIQGQATKVVPQFVDDLLARMGARAG